MPYVQNIKTPIGEDDLFPLFFFAFNQYLQIVKLFDF